MKTILCCLVVLTPAAAFAQAPGAPPPQPVVVVGGEGVVRATPDRAWITVGVESRAQNPQDAQRRNTEIMTPVLARLKSAGVPDEAVRTVGYDLQLEWDYSNNRRVPRGYVARNTVEVRVDDVGRVGELLELAVGSGATTLSGVRFDLKDRTALEREAIRLAVTDAREKAAATALAAGSNIERIVRIEERGLSSIEPPQPMLRQAQLAASDAPPIAAGQIEIRASVALTASLRPPR